ncbi:MAG: hypothetical protein AAF724_07265 [Pseudomonadota bacterium]
MLVGEYTSLDGTALAALIGHFADEWTILAFAAQLEEAKPWHARRPAIHASSGKSAIVGQD